MHQTTLIMRSYKLEMSSVHFCGDVGINCWYNVVACLRFGPISRNSPSWQQQRPSTPPKQTWELTLARASFTNARLSRAVFVCKQTDFYNMDDDAVVVSGTFGKFGTTTSTFEIYITILQTKYLPAPADISQSLKLTIWRVIEYVNGSGVFIHSGRLLRPFVRDCPHRTLLKIR